MLQPWFISQHPRPRKRTDGFKDGLGRTKTTTLLGTLIIFNQNLSHSINFNTRRFFGNIFANISVQNTIYIYIQKKKDRVLRFGHGIVPKNLVLRRKDMEFWEPTLGFPKRGQREPCWFNTRRCRGTSWLQGQLFSNSLRGVNCIYIYY